MVRLAAVLAMEARMAGRATLGAMEAANREATMRAEAIAMVGFVVRRGEVMKGRVWKSTNGWLDGWNGKRYEGMGKAVLWEEKSLRALVWVGNEKERPELSSGARNWKNKS